MQRLQRNAWRGLLTIAVLIGLVGLWALFVGIAEDPSVPLGVTGRTLSELAAESPDGYRFADSSSVVPNWTAIVCPGGRGN